MTLIKTWSAVTAVPILVSRPAYAAADGLQCTSATSGMHIRLGTRLCRGMKILYARMLAAKKLKVGTILIRRLTNGKVWKWFLVSLELSL